MKVLFAVSNEEISESIVKRYQKEYKQIISYKNVYYFNAILKELQKDKTYDRIVISEDLEAFTHTQYDQIDKFIFDKLDSISDEATDLKGTDIPIILICSDRRTVSEDILVKLFGIGIYNAIIGNDRSVEEVCKLINRPRAKKDAKMYYKIDVENVNYQSENENDVSEMEIQNILAHYARIGKNEQKYVESFDNIAAQYNDTQLRIISKFLPLNVRAVLEEKSPKYQKVMSFNNSVSDTLRRTEKEERGPSEKLLTTKEKTMSRPVVIPTAVNMNSTKKLVKKPNKVIESEFEDIDSLKEVKIIEEDKKIEEEPQPIKRGRGRPRKNAEQSVELKEEANKRGRGRPRKNTINPEESSPMLPMDIDEEENKNILTDLEEVTLPGIEEVTLPGIEESILPEVEETILPGIDKDSIDPILPGMDEEPIEDILPGLDYKEEQHQTYNSPMDNRNYNEYNNANSYQNNTFTEYEDVDISRLLTSDKKIVTFVGTSKNGTSFIVNNLAELLSSYGINTAILDTTKNRNSYYIYTNNEEELRKIASNCILNLSNGIATGISVNKNLTVYTSLPNEEDKIGQTGRILETLLQKHSLILIDTDFETPITYFKESQETYLVQSMDVLTIQPLTAFLRELKMKNILEERKLRIILNKNVKIRGITDKTIIGGMANYNEPAMSYMTELFDRNSIKYISIPFEEEVYIKYLESMIECNISLKGYSKSFIQTLKELGNMVYSSTNTYRPPTAKNAYGQRSNFTPNMNNTLEQMKRNY